MLKVIEKKHKAYCECCNKKRTLYTIMGDGADVCRKCLRGIEKHGF